MLSIVITIQVLTIVVIGCLIPVKIIERKREKKGEDLSKYKDF